MLIDVKAEVFPLKKVFTISRGSRSFAEVVTVKITKDGFSGFGECVPYQRYNETVQSVINQINTVNDFSKLIEIDKHLPAGAARNAIDCAFWDWQAKIKSTSVLIKKSLASIHELNSANKLIEEWSLDFFTVSMRCNAFGSITIALIIMTNWLGVR